MPGKIVRLLLVLVLFAPAASADTVVITSARSPLTVVATPEPATVLFFLSGLAGVGLWRRSRRET